MEAVRAELQALQQQRAAIEADIAERTARLNAPGQPGMHDSLIDKEGFPRADIDVFAVRTDRAAVIRLSNDHKALSSQLEALLHRLHELARQAGVTSLSNGGAQRAVSPPTPSPSAPASAVSAATAAAQHDDKRPRLDAAAGPSAPAAAAAGLRPFAVVDQVSEGSPAAAAGIQLGDQLCRFGSTQSSSSSGSSGGVSAVLQAVAAELQAHEGRPVSTAWLRAGQQLELQLTPQRWDGRGLLGCHLRPL